MYKVIFAWTPDFAVSYLKSLIEDDRFEIAKIITQEDKKTWRKQKLTPPPVKITWEKYWIEVLQPKTKEEIIEILKKEKPDFFVVVAYWKILAKESLEIAKYNINVHWSILPKYRWASPIQSAILEWEKETWVSIMNIEEKMDAWSIWDIHKCKIEKYDTSSDIFDKLSKMSKLFPDDLDKIYKWELIAKKQNEDSATYCKKISKENGKIDWENENAQQIFNKLKAFTPWPGIWSEFKSKKLKILKADYIDVVSRHNCPPKNHESQTAEKDKLVNKVNIWQIFQQNWKILVKTKDWNLEIIEVQLEWKKPSKIWDFINGQKDFIWSVLN